MSGWLIVNARLVSEGESRDGDLRIRQGRIVELGSGLRARPGETLIDARGRLLLPGVIDTQVHCREPGLTRAGNLATESRAAVAGGVTSFLDMPDSQPVTRTRLALADKYSRAAGRAAANYGFYLAATGDNLDEIRALRAGEACAVHVSLGAGDGNAGLTSLDQLAEVLAHSQPLVSLQVQDATDAARRLGALRQAQGLAIPASAHADIHDRTRVLAFTRDALEIAAGAGSALHLTGLSGRDELSLLEPGALGSKRITASVGLPQLYFMDADYAELGNMLKSDPPIRATEDRRALRKALKSELIDIISSAHAPQLLRDKTGAYEATPPGMPVVQFTLPVAWSLVAARSLTPEQLVAKLSHHPARLFRVAERGFLREGYWADLVLLEPGERTEVNRQPMLSQCGWTPFAGRKLPGRVTATWVNGRLVWRDGLLTGMLPGQKLKLETR